MRTAEITLLHKKNARTNFANYRPISLLNCDYKILSRALCIALKPVIASLVHPDQTGFIPGRLISDNGLLFSSILEYADWCEEDEVRGGFLALDFEKAFDSVAFDWIEKVLQKAGIPTTFIKWVKLLYNNPLSAIMVNGKRGALFVVGRGIRQGCPLSPLIFALCVEPMACAVRAEPNLRGLVLKSAKVSLKISLFADDSSLFVQNVFEMKLAISIVQLFCQAAGMKLNAAKTEGVWLGNYEGTPPAGCPPGIKWLKRGEPIRILGYWLGRGVDESLVWAQVENKLSQRLAGWKGRSLTPLGRSLALKVMIMSCVWYLAFNITMKPARANRLRSVFWNFIWRGDTNLDLHTSLKTTAGHISREVAMSKYCDGGIQAIDFLDQVQAMRVKWLKLLLEPSHEAKWKAVVNARLCTALAPWFRSAHACICYKKFTPTIKHDLPTIWRETFAAFTNLNPQRTPDAAPSKLAVLRTPLWGNPEMGLGLTARWQRWAEGDIRTVGDIWDQDAQDWATLRSMSPDPDRFTVRDYAAIVAAIPADWVKILTTEEEWSPGPDSPASDDDDDEDDDDDDKKMEADTFTQDWGWKSAAGPISSLRESTVRETRLASLYTAPSKGPVKWEPLFPHVLEDSPNWHRAWLAVHRLRADPNVRYFLWQVMHGALRVGEHGMIKNFLAATDTPNTCPHCHGIETITHALFTCPFAEKVWTALSPLVDILLPTSWVRDNLKEWCLIGGFGSAGSLGHRKLSLFPDRVDALRVTVPWLIWKARCNLLFERGTSSPYDVARNCLRQLTP